MKSEPVAISKLIVDFGLYPRTKVEAVNVEQMSNALDLGITLPPIIVDSHSFKVADGFHRLEVHKKRGLTEIDCILKDYPDERALFLDAMALNAQHGRQLSPFDRTRCILRAEELKIPDNKVSVALCLTMDKIAELKTNKTAEVYGPDNGRVALKATVSHMVGKKITKDQAAVMPRIGGQQCGFYVNQILLLIEHDLVNRKNEFLMESMNKLHTVLGEFLKIS